MSLLRLLITTSTALWGASAHLLVLISLCWLAAGQVCAEEVTMPHRADNDVMTRVEHAGAENPVEEITVEQIVTRQPKLSDAQSETVPKTRPTRYGVGYEYRMSRIQRPQRVQRPDRPNRPGR